MSLFFPRRLVCQQSCIETWIDVCLAQCFSTFFELAAYSFGTKCFVAHPTIKTDQKDKKVLFYIEYFKILTAHLKIIHCTPVEKHWFCYFQFIVDGEVELSMTITFFGHLSKFAFEKGCLQHKYGWIRSTSKTTLYTRIEVKTFWQKLGRIFFFSTCLIVLLSFDWKLSNSLTFQLLKTKVIYTICHFWQTLWIKKINS